jgi:2'-hydroxyisoflavone reductase
VLETCRRVARSDVDLVWVDGEFLVEQGVGQWMELPLWVGPGGAAFLRAPVYRALGAGLRNRPLEQTGRDTLEWAESGEAPTDAPAGLAAENDGVCSHHCWRPRDRICYNETQIS